MGVFFTEGTCEQAFEDSPYIFAELSQHLISGDLILKTNNNFKQQSQNVLAVQFKNMIRYFDMNVSPLQDWQQKKVGLVVVLRDISARVEAEQLLQEINIDLEKRVIERTEALQTANTRLRVLDEFKTRLIVQKQIDFQRSLLTSTGLQLQTKIYKDNSLVQGNIPQLAYMVDNLLKNAFLYTNEGEIEVAVYHDSSTNNVVLEVSDTGIGISNEDLTNVFDQFYRGDLVSQSNIAGIGLGLYVVKEVVELHEGQVVIIPRDEVGTKFRVTFPACKNSDTF